LRAAERGKVKARTGQIRTIDFDVDKMPGGSLAMCIAILVGPSGSAGKIRPREDIAIACQQPSQRGPRLWRQMPVRDERSSADLTPGFNTWI
jgi:hypothetical protein